MAARPWWVERVTALLRPVDLGPLELGPLWRLSEAAHFVRQNVEPRALEVDVEAAPECAALWQQFGARERALTDAVEASAGLLKGRLRAGTFAPAAFRAHWEGLGFVRHADGSGSPADDWLDGLLGLSRLTAEGAPLDFATVNLASRAEKVADFLKVAQLTASDVVFDLGSGSGKLALTVAASSMATVRGVEQIEACVAAAERSAAGLGLSNVSFARGDVRGADLSGGTVFYLYYPFYGVVAQAVAKTLGTLGRQKDITLYVSGPPGGYGEYFVEQVSAGALRLDERRGEFSEVMVLRSARG